jgi:carbamoylphosphate synthase large subunit
METEFPIAHYDVTPLAEWRTIEDWSRPKPHVLVTACGCPGGPALIRALREEFYVVGCDCSELASGRFFADEFHVMPRGDDPDFALAILGLCDLREIDVVLPESSMEVLALSRERGTFEEFGVKVVVGKPRAVETALDKALTYRALECSDVPIPEWGMAWNEDKMWEIARWLGYPERPVVLKDPKGKGGRGFRVARTDVDRAALDMRSWPNSQIVRLDEAHGPWPLMVMEHLAGDESSADTFDSYAGMFGYTKIRRDCRMGVHHHHTAMWDQELWDRGVEVVEALDLGGFVNVQFMGGKLLEVNPRISTNFYGSGNYAVAGVRAALGMDPEYERPEDGTVAQYYLDNRP